MSAALLLISKKIFAYIATDNPKAAARLVLRIEEAARSIAASPYIGEVTRKAGFRHPVGNYLIVYELGADEVVVHYVRHGARRRPWGGEI